MKRFISFLILTSALFGIFSCNNNEKDFVNTTGLSISPSTLTLLIGRTAELTATVTPEDATSKLISWESSDVKVAHVDNFGRVTAMKEGTATAFELPAASTIKDKTLFNLDITKLMTDFSYEAKTPGSYYFQVKVTDALGKETQLAFELAVPAE